MPDETVQAGMTDNSAAGLAYITIIPAIIFLVVAPYNQKPFVRFHAWQSIFLGIAAFVIGFINIIPILGQIIFLIGMLVLFVAWIMAIIKAFKGERFELPVIGKFAAQQAGF
ncbi:MAG: DUF4870 domain-containing protein [Terracidiphilus sp.]